MLNKIKASGNRNLFLFIPSVIILIMISLFLFGCGCSSSGSTTSGMKVAWGEDPHSVLFQEDKLCFKTSGKYDVHITQKDAMKRDSISQTGHDKYDYGVSKIFFVPEEAGTQTIRIWTSKNSHSEFVITVNVIDNNDKLIIEKVSVRTEDR